jgi:hypothetical protein
MGKHLAVVAVLVSAMVVAAPPRIAAQSGAGAEYEGTCEDWYQVDFDVDAVDLDLTARSALSLATNWVTLSPGRYLLVLPHWRAGGPQKEIDLLRAQVLARYARELGLLPGEVFVANPEDAPEAWAGLARRDAALVFTCTGVPPVR